ncbi:peptide/nickel transport system ATP-binding protein [Thalassospira sp. MBR-102]|jgi:peptide/nickel transport system ATP-binding protein|uniref:Peptide ABC transporter ATP-binding protein n=3 Tax=Thalassospira TaxID=168934 RepID=A0ABR5Y6R9_9PROT|nr:MULTISPECIES: ABC transporter ATP-binding protein [Thalassospira]MAL28101.1 ABC transporter ATP-binding protein [Thalassospira sp.]MBR9817426.1 ABC transporter ATP-binding protein [Rhodospirillales bacterium]AJD51684.1 ABC transporter [Thalassospira xiamenensis M-5 = DSM 17429]KEO58862.1 peptide ABC transporter ATP-binding protein [Thalassospira permensis NBRC 106175]KZD06899.1 peptide ABC transporter ATP-binding protein [Thalassospira xiamenensis]|tara:strand:- start:20538 stop:21380 length:843 start_codon:yes stop_codon:yes gene_type:complete
MTNETLLSVKNLAITFSTSKGPVHAVRGVSFDLGRERLGIVGESGSGKSQTGRAILGLTAANGKITADQMQFHDLDLRNLSKRDWRKVRGARISMIMQDPKYSLNPVMTIGDQIIEAYREHHKVNATEAKRRALDMLAAVKIRDPERVFKSYPHEVSGGMGQRVMIAMMLIPDPEILIADEPTSALDVTVQLQVMAILDDLVRERGMALVFISHDLHLVSSFCDRVLVMYQGHVVEEIRASELDQAKHPYTQGLLNCLPKMDGNHAELPVLTREASWAEA